MTGILAILGRIPFLVYPLVIVTMLWLVAKHEVKHQKELAIVERAKQAEAVSKANLNAEAAAELYEEERTKSHTRTVYITRKVKDALQTEPVWAGGRLPTSVHDAASAAAAIADPGLAEEPVRPAQPAKP